MRLVNETHRFLRALGKRPEAPFSPMLLRFLEGCARTLPHPAWSALRQFDWEQELARLSSWLTRTLVTEPPPRGTSGLYFGLFNPVEKRKATAELYVAGYAASEERDAPLVDGEQTWWPEGRHAGSLGLRRTYALAYEARRPLGNDLEYPVALVLGALAARTLVSVLPPTLVLGDAKVLRVAAGFDSGDIVEVGALRRSGFVPDYRV